jgi:hypothetical protein
LVLQKKFTTFALMEKLIYILNMVLDRYYIKEPENFIYDYKINNIGKLAFIYLTLSHKHMLNDWDLREQNRQYVKGFGAYAGILSEDIVVVYDWV